MAHLVSLILKGAKRRSGSSRPFLVVLPTAVLFGTGTLAIAQQSARFRPPENVRTAAAMLAGNSLSAGIVTRLPEEMHDTFEAARRDTKTFPGARTAFSVLMKNSPTLPEAVVLPSSVQPEDVLEAFANRQPQRGTLIRRSINTPNAMLKAADAAACNAGLSQRTQRAHASGDLDDLASAVVEDASGVDVPDLLGGSCLGTHEGRHEVVNIAAGETLEQALNQIAAAFEGTVWVAVDTGKGECSLGLVFTRADVAGACQRALTGDLRPKRKSSARFGGAGFAIPFCPA